MRKILTFRFGLGAGFVLGVIAVVIASATALDFFSSSTIDESRAYRHLIPLIDKSPDKSCGAQGNAIPTITHPLQRDKAHSRLHEPFKTTDNSSYDCAIQHHVNQSVDYGLAFLEFNDAGHLIAPAQWDALKLHLKAQKNVNVLLFVHGWRNDAHIGSQDVERFQTLLSLSANYAQQRSKETKTIGIYIGWQGRMIDEKSDTNDPARGSMHAKALEWLATPTILSRKPRSDALANSIGRQILDVETLVKGDNGDKRDNKLIILGHSLGGNIVIQGLSDKLVERITLSQPTDQIRGVGDLVVLINPASQVRHFFAVQQAAFANPSPPIGSPVVVSLTAAKYFNQIADESNAWDTAVGKFLPIAHRVLTLNSGQPEDVQSIGNYLPSRVLQATTRTTVSLDLKGVSHEIEFDGSAGAITSYAFTGAGSTAAHPYCPKAEISVLMGSKPDDKRTAPLAAGWDTEEKNKNIELREWFNVPNPKPKASGSSASENGIRINIRHGAARHKCLHNTDDDLQCRNVAKDAGVEVPNGQYVQIPVIGPAWAPVWNAAVHSNVVDEHGGYLSHTLWCVLNRFALDRPAPSGRDAKKYSLQPKRVDSANEQGRRG